MANLLTTCRRTLRWLQARHKRSILAPLTGQDMASLEMFIHAVDLYTKGDTDGQRGAIMAMGGAVLAMQDKTRWLARETIIGVYDYCYVAPLWDRACMVACVRPALPPEAWDGVTGLPRSAIPVGE